MDPDSEISFDFPPFLRQYRSGRVLRHGSNATVPAGTDPLTGVVSKDIHVGAARARVYLPPEPDTAASSPANKLPVIVYFHGGGFVLGSPARPSTHGYLNDLVARAGAIGVSAYYRLAPEHPLPAAYDDGWAVVRWAATLGDGADPWLLARADLSRVFLAGCSSGANLAHNMAIRAHPRALPDGVSVRGLLAVHPYFNGKEAVGAEASSLGPEVREQMARRWGFVFPGPLGLDDPLVNPFVDDHARAAVARIPCECVLVCVAEHDSRLKERGLWYYRELGASGDAGEVELFESRGVGHAFHFDRLGSEEGVRLQQRMVAFIVRK